MDFFIKFEPQKFENLIEPHHKILLIGSCFTEHMGMRFEKWGWPILQNPTGVIYNPLSICTAIDRILHKKIVTLDELYIHDGIYHHWDFHSRFSHTNPEQAVAQMNASIEAAHTFIQEVDWIFLTWGSAHYYTFKETGYDVSNCHRVPNKLFDKKMYEIDEMYNAFLKTLTELKQINPNVKVCQTVSPVRHIKDGIVENSISKARLVELSHRLTLNNVEYFPAYEILIDELRDYRFYDADLVHPNYAATQYVWEKLIAVIMSDASKTYLSKMIELMDAYNHKPRFEGTEAFSKFIKKYYDRCFQLENEYPHLDLKVIKEYFANRGNIA